jgi:hypothetical protein
VSEVIKAAFAYLDHEHPTVRAALEEIRQLQELARRTVSGQEAEKDAALTDEQIIEIFHDHYTEEPGDAEPGHILPFARAILAAKDQ